MKEKNALLSNLVSSNLYAQYSGILSLSNNSLLLVDCLGDILLEFNSSPEYCRQVCQQNAGRVCSGYLSRIEKGETGRFVCESGLENTISPVIVRKETIGYVIGLQAYSEETEYQRFMIDIPKIAQKKQVEPSFIAKCLSAFKTLTQAQIDTHEQLCLYIARNISRELSERSSSINPDVARLSIEKEVLEKKVIDLEVKNMALVINPHFLFNTLNTIARIAYFEHSHKTEELIYHLSDLLRYNIKQEDQLHTIESEVDNIEKYLYIQKARFKNRLEYELDIADDIKQYRMPNMVLQPVVENALIHGITPKRDGGKIQIFAERYKENIYISVMDNGNGFDKEILENIYNVESKMGLGFRSTDQRLKGYYGKEYGLTIVKSDFSGCTVRITIPTQSNVRWS